MRGYSGSRSVQVYFPAFAGTDCANPQRDGQGELLGRLVTYRGSLPVSSINRAWRRVTLIDTNALPLSHTATPSTCKHIILQLCSRQTTVVTSCTCDASVAVAAE